MMIAMTMPMTISVVAELRLPFLLPTPPDLCSGLRCFLELWGIFPLLSHCFTSVLRLDILFTSMGGIHLHRFHTTLVMSFSMRGFSLFSFISIQKLLD